VSNRNPLDQLTGLAALQEITKRLGELGSEVANAANRKAGEGAASERSFTIDTPNGPVSGMSRMSFRVGSLSDRMPRGGAARPQAARTAERTRKAAPDLDGTRPPLVDCFDEGDAVVITAELPGVTEDQIRVTVEAASVLIETTGSRRYRTEETLPYPVRAESLSTVLRHGILEIRLARQDATP
jgi:HSP20 family protein